jgi:hypothetical protein
MVNLLIHYQKEQHNSSVVHNNFDDDGHVNGSSIELFMPSSQVEKVTQMHSELCSSYLQWHKEKNDP